MTIEELQQKYEILLAHKDMEIAQLTEDAILHIRYLVALQDDLRNAGIGPSHSRLEIERIVFDERRHRR